MAKLPYHESAGENGEEIGGGVDDTGSVHTWIYCHYLAKTVNRQQVSCFLRIWGGV